MSPVTARMRLLTCVFLGRCSTARLMLFKSILRLQIEDWLMLFITVYLPSFRL